MRTESENPPRIAERLLSRSWRPGIGSTKKAAKKGTGQAIFFILL